MSWVTLREKLDPYCILNPINTNQNLNLITDATACYRYHLSAVRSQEPRVSMPSRVQLNTPAVGASAQLIQ